MNIITTISYQPCADYDLRIKQLVDLLLLSQYKPESPICQNLLEGEYDPKNGYRRSLRVDAGRADIGGH